MTDNKSPFADRNFRYQSDLDEAAFETLAVREGQRRTHECEHSEAIFTTSSYVFNSAAEAAARFSGDVEGNVYSRYTNPTVRLFEERLAALEGAEECAATSSGMAAIYAVCMAHLQAGDSMVVSRSVFGSTNVLMEKFVSKFGIDVRYVDLLDTQQWSDAIDETTQLLFLESPSNPMAEIADIEQLAKLAHDNDALLVVDNCFCTPALQQPLKLGADLVVHSATKYLDGQGRCIGGAVLGSHEVIEPVVGVLRSAGPTMSPFNAWVFAKGLETLSLRMKAHSESAMDLAEWLLEQPQVEKVNYSGLVSHPQYELAKKQQSAFGGVLSFTVKGVSDQALEGQDAAWAFIDATRMISITANLGDAKTTITHPATTTHSRLSEEQREKAGIADSLIRIAVGLEALDDIKADISRGFTAVK